IHNESEKIIAFAGRALRPGDEPKYLNSPETPLYHKTYVLYNLHRAKDAVRKRERAVLVEGYMDVIGVYSAGVREVVASCGTALTNTQVRALKRHSETIVVNFDPDAAGSNAAERSIQMLLDEAMRVRILELDGGLDPDEYVKQNGVDVYRAQVDQAAGYFHWLTGRARKRYDTRTAEGRMDALKFLLPAVQRVSDKLERAAIAAEVAGLLGVEQGLVFEQFRKTAIDRRATAPTRPSSNVPHIERILIHSMLTSGEARAQVMPRLRQLPAVARFQTHAIFDALLNLDATGGPVTFGQLEARLPENDRGLLHEVISADEMGESAMGLESALACLRKLELMQDEAQISELKARIKSAEQQGKMEEALRWMQELEQIRRA
ncbi:MAG: toprim domain-containing protein, partial [Bryobacteraceae bacterium]